METARRHTDNIEQSRSVLDNYAAASLGRACLHRHSFTQSFVARPIFIGPNLSVSQHAAARNMIADGRVKDEQIGKAIGCSRNAVGAIRANIQCDGTTTAPRNVSGPKRAITPEIRQSLLDRLAFLSEEHLDKAVIWLWDKYNVLRSTSATSRELKVAGWSRKRVRRVAKQRNQDLRDRHRYKMSFYGIKQFFFVDETGCNRNDGCR